MSLILVTRVLHYAMGHYDNRTNRREDALNVLGHAVAGKLSKISYGGSKVRIVSAGADGENAVYARLRIYAGTDAILKLRGSQLSESELRNSVCRGRDKLALKYVDKIRIEYENKNGEEVLRSTFDGC
jgi:hypothetical protein